MNPDIDPRKFGEVAKPKDTTPAVKPDEPIRITLPAMARRHMQNSEFFKNHPIISDLISFYALPSAQSGVHKLLSGLIDFFILDRDLKPSNSKNGNVYIYNDRDNGYRGYDSYYGNNGFSASYVGADGKTKPITADRYRKPSKASFVRIPHYDPTGELCPWSTWESETMADSITNHLSRCVENGEWASVQDLYDACGQSGAPSTATEHGWPSIGRVEIYIDPYDKCYLIVKMPDEPLSREEIEKKLKKKREED